MHTCRSTWHVGCRAWGGLGCVVCVWESPPRPPRLSPHSWCVHTQLSALRVSAGAPPTATRPPDCHLWPSDAETRRVSAVHRAV